MRRLKIILTLFLSLSLMPIEVKANNITTIINELQKINQSENRITIIYWMASEYFEIFNKNDPSISESSLKEVTTVFDNYVVFMVSDIELGMLGNHRFASQEEIVNNIFLKTSKGEKIYALKDNQIPENLSFFLSVMEPYMKQLLGEFGQSINFIIFPAKDAQGNLFFDKNQSEILTAEYNNNIYQWRLPLASTLPLKYDPETGESFPGNYNYNPFTGESLKLK